MTYQQHTITGSNAKQRDKADNSRNAYLTRCYHQCKYPTNQRQRQIQQNDSTLGCILKLGIKQQEENNHHKNSTFIQRILHITDRAFNKTALTENICRNVYISRKILLQILQCGFQLLCQFNSPSLGLFGNGQQYGRFSSFRSSTQFGFLRTNLHIGNILQCNGHPFHRLDDGT